MVTALALALLVVSLAFIVCGFMWGRADGKADDMARERKTLTEQLDAARKARKADAEKAATDRAKLLAELDKAAREYAATLDVIRQDEIVRDREREKTHAAERAEWQAERQAAEADWGRRRLAAAKALDEAAAAVQSAEAAVAHAANLLGA